MTPIRDGRVLELRVPARPAELKSIRDAVRGCVEKCGCDEKSTADIVLAVDEACQNIIRHAYGERTDGQIVIEIDHVEDKLVFSLTDSAPTIDPGSIKPRDLDDIRPGGLGVHFIRQVMDETTFTKPPSGQGNLLRMVRRID